MRKIERIGLLALWTLAVAPTAWADEAGKPVLAVSLTESRGTPLSADEMVGLTELLAASLGEDGSLQIVPRPSMRDRLAGKVPEEAGPLARASIDFLIRTAISRVGARCLLTGEVHARGQGVVVAATALRSSCNADDLIEGMESLSKKLRGLFPLRQEQGPLLGVNLMESRGLSIQADELIGLSDYLSVRLQELSGMRLLDRRILRADDQKRVALAEKLRGELNFSINTSGSRVGRNCLLTSSIVDVQAKATLKAVSERADCDPESLVEAVEKISNRLAAAMRVVNKGG